jgi:hypothetical protein
MQTSTKWVIGGLVGVVALYLVWPKKALAASTAPKPVSFVPQAPAGQPLPSSPSPSDPISSITWTAFRYGGPGYPPLSPPMDSPYSVLLKIQYQSGSTASWTAGDLVNLPYMTAKQVTPNGLPDSSSMTYTDGSHDPIGMPDASTRATILAAVNKFLAQNPQLVPGYPPALLLY